MLAGTGLHFEFLNDRTVRIFAGSSCAFPSGCAGPPVGAAALAAESPPRPPSPDDPLEEVIVNGLRWWLDPTRAMAPVTVLDRRDIERSGQSSIGDVLQALPMTTGSPINTNANAPGLAEERGGGAAGDGSVRVRVHDLPTIVLLNGRRLPNSGLGADASVDLNTLPMSFIERVEVLASGASAAVGADAVGGVVNIVTRQSNRGLELSGTRTITERGDGEIVTGQAAIGFDLLGGTWSLGLDYVEQDSVTMDRRSYSALPLIIVDGNGTVKPDGLNNLPVDGYIYVPEENALGLDPGNIHLCRAPPARRPRTIDRTCANATASIRALQLFADAERAVRPVAARLASAGRKHESLPRSIRSSPGVCAAGRTGKRFFDPHRSAADGRITDPSRGQLLQPLRHRPVV